MLVLLQPARKQINAQFIFRSDDALGAKSASAYPVTETEGFMQSDFAVYL